MTLGTLLLIVLLAIGAIFLARKVLKRDKSHTSSPDNPDTSSPNPAPENSHQDSFLNVEIRRVERESPDQDDWALWNHCLGILNEIKSSAKYASVRIDEDMFDFLEIEIAQRSKDKGAIKPRDFIDEWIFSPDNEEAAEKCRSIATKTLAKQVATEVARAMSRRNQPLDDADNILPEVKRGLLDKRSPSQWLVKKGLIALNWEGDERLRHFLQEQTVEALTGLAREHDIPVKSRMRKAEIIEAIVNDRDKLNQDWVIHNLKSTDPQNYVWANVIDEVVDCVYAELKRQYAYAKSVMDRALQG
ncbi:hypothetical protein D6779_04470 [Candidatus Parcubacteria bacterium]|nr:MAG: hypothetical protein D6779_04470 [Candidatus Parcubacteria bacterium]